MHTPCYQLSWLKGLAGLSQTFTNMLHIAFKLLGDRCRTCREAGINVTASSAPLGLCK